MLTFIKKIIITIATPLHRMLSRQSTVNSLTQFSKVEEDSAWQMLRAAEQTNDGNLRHYLFQNALEEKHHAYLFMKLAKAYPQQKIGTSPQSRVFLYKEYDSAPEFLAYHHISEKEIHSQFKIYAKYSPSDSIRKTFEQIIHDEANHQHNTENNLKKCVTSRQLKTYKNKASRKRFFEFLSRFGNSIGDLVQIIFLFPIFLLIGIFFNKSCRNYLVKCNNKNSH